MTTYEAVESALIDTGVIAILRGITGEPLGKMLDALYAGGIRLAEITLNTPDALASIREQHARWAGHMWIGAGTVLDATQAEAALEAGADFIVTPNTDEDVILLCKSRGAFIAAGALTPTEIVRAMMVGCRYIKVFPVRAMGDSYVKDVLAPLSAARLIAVGGVNGDNIARYTQQGVVGAGVGGGLCKVPADGDYAAITAEAVRLLTARASSWQGLRPEREITD